MPLERAIGQRTRLFQKLPMSLHPILLSGTGFSYAKGITPIELIVARMSIGLGPGATDLAEDMSVSGSLGNRNERGANPQLHFPSTVLCLLSWLTV